MKFEFNKPNVLERLLATAKKVKLGPRGNQNLTLEFTELRQDGPPPTGHDPFRIQ